MLTAAAFHHYVSDLLNVEAKMRQSAMLGFCFLIVLAWLLIRARHMFLIYHQRRPRKALIAGYPNIFGQIFTGVYSIIATPGIISRAYSKAKGTPIAIPTLVNYHVCVSSTQQIKELGNASSRQISFNNALDDMLYPHYTMHGYQYDPADPHNNWSVTALKSGLRASLPRIRPALQVLLEKALAEEISGKKDTEGWAHTSASSVAFKVAGNLNTYTILGQKLAQDPAIVKAALDYARDAAITTEVLRFTPSILHPPVGYLAMHWSGAQQKLCKAMAPVVHERLERPAQLENADPKPTELDCIQWIIESSRKEERGQTVERVTQRALGFLFAAAYQMPMLVTFILYNLCKYPEYFPPLRDEIAAFSEEDVYSSTRKAMPLLDSFLKETARHHPLQSIVGDRKVMSPFTFADGTHIPAGNWLCIPQQAVMMDPGVYANPTEFDGFRFANVDGDGATSQTRFSHPSPSFPFWGMVGRSCPARFYVSMVTKMMVVHILKYYDFKLADENAEVTFSWGTTLLPHPRLKLLIRRKES